MSRFVCLLSQKEIFVPFFPSCHFFFVEAPYKLRALPRQTVFDFLPRRHKKLCHFISDVMDICWLAKTSNKPISLTTRLAVNPDL